MIFSGVPVPLSAVGKGNGELINAAGRRGLHGILQIRVILLAGTLLPLLTAAAGTGIVAADLHGLFHGLLFRRGAVAAHVFHGGLGDTLPLDLQMCIRDRYYAEYLPFTGKWIAAYRMDRYAQEQYPGFHCGKVYFNPCGAPYDAVLTRCV